MNSDSDELNPHHPATKAMHDNWHKVVVALMKKFGHREIVLTLEDIRAIEGENITFQSLQKGIHLRLVGEEEARQIARIQGGVSNS